MIMAAELLMNGMNKIVTTQKSSLKSPPPNFIFLRSKSKRNWYFETIFRNENGEEKSIYFSKFVAIKRNEAKQKIEL